MARYIGLDAHGASCTFGVIGPSGRKLRQDVVETHGAALVQYLRNIPGRKHLCLEEGTHSAWLYEILSPHVEEIGTTQGSSLGMRPVSLGRTSTGRMPRLDPCCLRHDLRCRGWWTRRARCERGTHRPASIIQWRSVSREMTTSCLSANFSQASVGPKSAYRLRKRSTVCSRSAVSSLWLLARPRLREISPVAPSARYARHSRST